MSAKGSDQEQSSKRPSTESCDLNRGTTRSNNATEGNPCCMNAFRPTRNCGCNTEKQAQ